MSVWRPRHADAGLEIDDLLTGVAVSWGLGAVTGFGVGCAVGVHGNEGCGAMGYGGAIIGTTVVLPGAMLTGNLLNREWFLFASGLVGTAVGSTPLLLLLSDDDVRHAAWVAPVTASMGLAVAYAIASGIESRSSERERKGERQASSALMPLFAWNQGLFLGLAGRF